MRSPRADAYGRAATIQPMKLLVTAALSLVSSCGPVRGSPKGLAWA
jgi:hypothetical protein